MEMEGSDMKYRTSEIVLGKALRDGYRDKVTIATKMPAEAVHKRAEMEALLEEELKKLQTDRSSRSREAENA